MQGFCFSERELLDLIREMKESEKFDRVEIKHQATRPTPLRNDPLTSFVVHLSPKVVEKTVSTPPPIPSKEAGSPVRQEKAIPPGSAAPAFLEAPKPQIEEWQKNNFPPGPPPKWETE